MDALTMFDAVSCMTHGKSTALELQLAEKTA